MIVNRVIVWLKMKRIMYLLEKRLITDKANRLQIQESQARSR